MHVGWNSLHVFTHLDVLLPQLGYPCHDGEFLACVNSFDSANAFTVHLLHTFRRRHSSPTADQAYFDHHANLAIHHRNHFCRPAFIRHLYRPSLPFRDRLEHRQICCRKCRVNGFIRLRWTSIYRNNGRHRRLDQENAPSRCW